MRKDEAWVRLNGFVICCGHLERLNSKHLEITRGREVGFKAMDLIVQGGKEFVRRGVCFNIHFGNWDREKVVRVSRQRCQHWMVFGFIPARATTSYIYSSFSLTPNFLTLSLIMSCTTQPSPLHPKKPILSALEHFATCYTKVTILKTMSVNSKRVSLDSPTSLHSGLNQQDIQPLHSCDLEQSSLPGFHPCVKI